MKAHLGIRHARADLQEAANDARNRAPHCRSRSKTKNERRCLRIRTEAGMDFVDAHLLLGAQNVVQIDRVHAPRNGAGQALQEDYTSEDNGRTHA